MAKTLVVAQHKAGPLVNGADGCHARAGDGMCPGVETAAWLNGLGDDEEPYSEFKSVTNGAVRWNWLRASAHVVAMEPELAQARARLAQAKADVRSWTQRVKTLEQIRRRT